MNRFEKERAEMIELLRHRGILDEQLLKAMRQVEREQFVLPAFMNRAYDDSALPIANGQTISQPYTVAFQTEKLQVGKDSKVLEIGTGSGYQAAVLAEMGCRVFTIERHMELHLQARKLLEKLGYHVAARCGDGTVGWNEYAPVRRHSCNSGCSGSATTIARPACRRRTVCYSSGRFRFAINSNNNSYRR